MTLGSERRCPSDAQGVLLLPLQCLNGGLRPFRGIQQRCRPGDLGGGNPVTLWKPGRLAL